MKATLLLSLLALFIVAGLAGCAKDTVGDPIPAKTVGEGASDRKTGLDPQ
jgi:hypothetical protein